LLSIILILFPYILSEAIECQLTKASIENIIDNLKVLKFFVRYFLELFLRITTCNFSTTTIFNPLKFKTLIMWLNKYIPLYTWTNWARKLSIHQKCNSWFMINNNATLLIYCYLINYKLSTLKQFNNVINF